MQIASMWLNLYGHQAVQRELQKGLKTQEMHFYPFFELTSDIAKNIENWESWKSQFFFESAFLNMFFQKNIFFSSSQ